MGIDRITLKLRAKEAMRSASPSPMLVTLLYLAIVNGISFWLTGPAETVYALILEGYPPDLALSYAFSQPKSMLLLFLSLLITLFTWVLASGYSLYCMAVSRGSAAGPQDLFSVFHLAGKVILLQLLQTVFIYLWSMLFFFPGIIAAYRYRMALYILLDHPELSPLECIHRSKLLMFGHKMERCILDLSFMGWLILFSLPVTVLSSLLMFLTPLGMLSSFLISLVTVLCSIWITPYIECTTVGFYDALLAASPAAGSWGSGGPDRRQEQPGEDDAPWHNSRNGSSGEDPWN